MVIMQAVCKAMQQHVRTAGCELENMNMIPAEEGGDLYLCNGSFTKLSDAGAAYEQKDGENSNETSDK